MLRKLLGLIAVAGMLLMTASSATAGFFDPVKSELRVNLGALPTVIVKGSYLQTGNATLSNNGTGHDLSDTTDIWVTSNLQVGTSLLTGVALISRLTLTASNQAGNFTASFAGSNPLAGAVSVTPSSGTLCPSGCLGSNTVGLNGQFILGLVGFGLKAFPLAIVGGTGATAALPLGQNQIVATGAPFITGKAVITNITTNIISLPDRGGVTGVGVTLEPLSSENVRTFTTLGGFITDNPGGILKTQGTVTLGGNNALASASQGGSVTLISPLRVQTGPLGVGNIPGKITKKFEFVPEPGTVLLLVSGAAGLILIGRKRMKG